MPASAEIRHAVEQAFAWSCPSDVCVVDARSPGEFEQGHVPESFNIPLLDNEQRALVGTCYKTQGRQQAIDLGMELAAPFFLDKINAARAVAQDRPVAVYCARGGLRSEIITWLLNKGGMHAVQLPGGYKQWRGFVLASLQSNIKVRVVSGMTGVGKTEILHALRTHGQQVLDLEAIAQHRGSAFGGIGMPEQRSQEQFENILAIAIHGLNTEEIVWLEDESRFIGKLRVPDPLYDRKCKAQRVIIERSFGARLVRVLDEYGRMPLSDLMEKTEQLRKRLGFDQVKQALEHLQAGQMESWATMMLHYYDQLYAYSAERNKETHIAMLNGDQCDMPQLIKKMTSIVDSHE